MPSTSLAAIRVVIPARFGSTRLPGKPLIDLAGEPMIVRVYERVKQALPTATITVATDDRRIEAVLAARGIPYAMTSSAHASGTDRVAEVARSAGWSDSDIVLNVQGDEPLLPHALLRAFVEYCQAVDEFSIATLASVALESAQVDDANIVKVVTDRNGHALYFSRAPIPFSRDRRLDQAASDGPSADFLRHIGIYAYSHAVLQRLTSSPTCEIERREQLEQLRALWLGIPILVMHWPDSVPAGIDTPGDVMRVSNLFKQESR